MWVGVMVFQISKKPQKRYDSQGYSVLNFPEATKEKFQLGQGVVVSKDSEKRDISQVYGVLEFQEAAKDHYQLGLWCCRFPRSCDRKMPVRVMVYLFSQKPKKKIMLSQKPRKGNISQGYGLSQTQRKRIFSWGQGVVAFQETAKQKCFLRLSYLGCPRGREREILVKVSWFTKLLQKRNDSQGDAAVAFQEAVKDK